MEGPSLSHKSICSFILIRRLCPKSARLVFTWWGMESVGWYREPGGHVEGNGLVLLLRGRLGKGCEEENEF